ncbi:hypothetical protein PAPHI01_2191 [Pancytospora philotis]|nr:hypothetical protein PAPHI01_2191 [Pancytospora philotis]
MKRQAYRLFTAEHGIRMGADVLNYICEHVTSEEALEKLLLGFKAKYNTSEVTLGQLESLEAAPEPAKEAYKVHSLRYRPGRLSERYEACKKLMKREITPISLLEEGSAAFVFGIFYRSRTGSPVLEDGHSCVELALDRCTSNAFLFENMFVGCEGALLGGAEPARQVFSVDALVLPPTRVHSLPNNFLERRPLKLCVLGCVGGDSAPLKRLEQKYSPDLFIASLCAKCQMGVATPVIALCCGCADTPAPTPRSSAERLIAAPSDREAAHPRASVFPASNPCLLEFNDKKIAIISSGIFRHKENGLFVNKQPLESFLASLRSQCSFNPFVPGDLSFDGLLPPGFVPNILVILQDSLSFTLDVDSMQFASIAPASKGQCLMIDLLAERIEVCGIDE